MSPSAASPDSPDGRVEADHDASGGRQRGDVGRIEIRGRGAARPRSARARAAVTSSACARASRRSRWATATGSRIAREWFESARPIAWRIHSVAYVENRKPLRQSNFSTARISPSVPSWMRSSSVSSVPW